jgi:hypothetical protein
VFVRLRGDGTMEGQEHVEPIDQARPGLAMAAAGPLFAVAYVMEGAIGVQVLQPDGRPARPPVLLPGSAGAHAPSLAPLGSALLASWTSPRGERGAITIARIDPANGDVHPLSAIQTSSARARGSIAAGGERILLAFVDAPLEAAPELAASADGGTTDAAAAPAPAFDAGAVESGGPVPAMHPAVYTTAFEITGVRTMEPQLQPGEALDEPPSVAWNGSAFGLAWTGSDRTVGGPITRFAVIEPAGTRRGEPLEASGSVVPGAMRFPARLAWTGSAYVLARPGAAPEEIVVHRFGPNGCDAR